MDSGGTANPHLHKVVRLLRLVENRKCADCSRLLGDGKQTYAQLKHRVWICKGCALTHNRFVVTHDAPKNKVVAVDESESEEVKEVLSEKAYTILEEGEGEDGEDNPLPPPPPRPKKPSTGTTLSKVNKPRPAYEELMLALSRTWTKESLERMVQAGSNVVMNKSLERYVHAHGLTKPTADSTDAERELWIRCKYSHLFAIPALPAALQPPSASLGDDKDEDSKPIKPIKPPRPVSVKTAASLGAEEQAGKPRGELPAKLVDFFMTVGPGPLKPEQASSSSHSPRGSLKPADAPALPPLPANCEAVVLPADVDYCMPDPRTDKQKRKDAQNGRKPTYASEGDLSDEQGQPYDPSDPTGTLGADRHSPSGEFTPAQAAPFIFPSGLRLSPEELPPRTFSYVLTDSSRVKMYGVALVFYELLDPVDVERLVAPADGEVDTSERRASLRRLEGWQLVYAPRALTVVSHYPFYHAFSEFLTQLFHASLSIGPVPLERYVANFMLETPLPPLGRSQVAVGLTRGTLLLSRPPVNQLPMVDFSYRPLFACLSVDVIITVFKAICGEYSVCFVSDNLSLLTPVQEAMLSFLFPLVWQGVYIPILPLHMREILDAPVPLITGVHTSYLDGFRPSQIPSAVLFVYLDKNELAMGKSVLQPFHNKSDEISLHLPLQAEDEEWLDFHNGMYEGRNEFLQYLETPNPKMFVKLRQKLQQYGECICVYGPSVAHNSRETSPQHGASSDWASLVPRTPLAVTAIRLLSSAGMPFPSDEHLTPITVWTLSGGQNNISGGIDEYGGANKGRYSGRSVTNARTCATQSFGLGGSADGQAGRRGSVGATGAEESNHVSLLDPSNNGATAGTSRDCATFRWGAGDCFDSLEVRSAFLRFFVALFIHTDEEKAQIDLALGAMHGGNAAQRGRDSSGRRSSMVDRAKEYVSGSHAPPHGIEPFYLSLLQTQMVSEFNDERKFHSDYPEVRFFEESVFEKLNRSSFTFTQKSTPFLSSTADDIRETYAPPQPNVSGLRVGEVFEYSRGFPKLLSSPLFGPIRRARVLVRSAERRRHVNVKNAVSDSINRFLGLVATDGQSSITGTDSVRLDSSDGGSTKSDTSTHESADGGVTLDFDSLLARGEAMFLRVEAGVTAAQARARAMVRRRRYLRVYAKIVKIQSLFRAFHSHKAVQHKRSLLVLRKEMVRIVKVQAHLRGLVCRRRYQRVLRMVLSLQSTYRSKHTNGRESWRSWFVRTSQQFRLMTALFRGWFERGRDRTRRYVLFLGYCRQMLPLWRLLGVPLRYRALFWSTVRADSVYPSYLLLAVVRDELQRLYRLGSIDVIRISANAGLAGLGDRGSHLSSNSHSHSIMSSMSPISSQTNYGSFDKTIAAVGASPAFNAVLQGLASPKHHFSAGAGDVSNHPFDVRTSSAACVREIGAKHLKWDRDTLYKIEGNVAKEKEERERLYKSIKSDLSPEELEDLLLETYCAFGVCDGEESDVRMYIKKAKKKKEVLVYKMAFCGVVPSQLDVIDRDTHLIALKDPHGEIDRFVRQHDIAASAILRLYYGPELTGIGGLLQGAGGTGEGVAQSSFSAMFGFGSSGAASAIRASMGSTHSADNDHDWAGPLEQWARAKKARRVNASMAESVRACLTIIAGLKSTAPRWTD